MEDAGGTLLSADFAATSWKVIPWNSGVLTVRSAPAKGRRGGWAGSSAVPWRGSSETACVFHRMLSIRNYVR
jgi:hypothetical protein